MSDYIEQIKARVTPYSIISKNVTLKHKGNNEYLGICPFHQEKTPSFTVSDTKGFYHCFGCGAHGDIFTFLMQYQGVDYKEALRRLAGEAGVVLPEYSNQQLQKQSSLKIFYEIFEEATRLMQKQLYMSEHKDALEYIQARGIKSEVIEEYRLGYAPLNDEAFIKALTGQFKIDHLIESSVLSKGKYGLYNRFKGRVIFPIMDKQGEVIAFGGRILSGDGPKYLNSPENPIFHKGDTLYGLHLAQREAYKSQEMIICEGYMDVISLANAGIRYAVAPLGANVRINQIQTLWQIVSEPTICMDSDNAGKKAMAKIAREIMPSVKPSKSLKFAILKGAKDPDEVISKYGVDTFLSAVKNAIPLADLLFKMEQKVNALNTPEKRSDFRERLIKLSESVEDKNLSSSYRAYFIEKYRELFFIDKKSGKAKENFESVILALMGSKNKHILTAIAALINHPVLIEDEEIHRELIEVEIESQILDKIRDFILNRTISCLSDNGGLKEEDLSKIIERNFSFSINSYSFDWFVSREASLEEARSGIMRAFKINALKIIEDQIKEVKLILSTNADISIFERLAALKHHEQALQAELNSI